MTTVEHTFMCGLILVICLASGCNPHHDSISSHTAVDDLLETALIHALKDQGYELVGSVSPDPAHGDSISDHSGPTGKIGFSRSARLDFVGPDNESLTLRWRAVDEGWFLSVDGDYRNQTH